MPFHMWQMQQEFCTTEQCLRNMDGKFRKRGMNLLLSVIRFRVKESSHCILDLKIHGLVLHRGMRSPLILHRQMSAAR